MFGQMIVSLNIQDFGVAQRIFQLEEDALGTAAGSIEALQHSGERFIAFKEGERFVGAVGYVADELRLKIQRLVLHPDYVRSAIPSKLLDALLAICPTCQQISAETAATNTPALQLFQQQGFQIVERFRNAEGLAMLRLEKSQGHTH